MKLSSLRVKVIGVVIVCLLAAAAGILAVLHVNFARQTDQITLEAVAQARQIFQNLEASDISKLSAVLETIVTDDALGGQHSEAYRPILLAHARPLFARLKGEYDFTLLIYHNPEAEGTVFLRVHNPGVYGDPVKKWMYDECVRTKSLVAGKDLGDSGFALRAMMPQRDHDGNLLGYVEVGEEIGRFFQIMRQQTGNQYGLALKKSLLQRHKWLKFRQSLGQPDNWDDLQSIVVADRTTQDEKLMNVQIDIDSIPAAGEVLGRVASDGATYVRGVFPINTADGKRTGAVFVAKDMTAAFANLRHLEFKIAGLILAVMVIISVIISIMLNVWVFRRLDNMIEIATRVVGGDYEAEIPKSADDEVGEFECLFDQFRKVFLGVVNAHT